MTSKGVNKAIILGNLGQDPEVRFLPSGAAVANLSIATSEEWKDKQTGEAKSSVEWHRISILGKLAEIAGEYLKKGSKVYIEGQLQTKKYTDNQGIEKYSTDIVVQGFGGVMQMLDSANGNNNQQPQQNYQQQAPQQQPRQQTAQGGFQQQPQRTAQQQQAHNAQFQQPAPQNNEQASYQQHQQGGFQGGQQQQMRPK